MRYIQIAIRPRQLFLDREEMAFYSFRHILPPIFSWESAASLSALIIMFIFPFLYRETPSLLLAMVFSIIAAILVFVCVHLSRIRDEKYFNSLSYAEKQHAKCSVSDKQFSICCFSRILGTIMRCAVICFLGWLPVWLAQRGEEIGYGGVLCVFLSIQLVWLFILGFQPISCFVCFLQYRQWKKETGENT